MTENINTEIRVPEAEQNRFGFDEKLLPELIHGHLGKLNELNKKVLDANAKAKSAIEKANEAKTKSAERGFFKDYKKEAIVALQAMGVDLASAIQSGAEAQKISFEFQDRLAKVTKYLFELGVSNIAANRFVVQELELRLRGATEEELSELARQEVISVIRQLKQQEDLLKKQEQMFETLKGHDFKIKHVLSVTDELEIRRKTQEDRLGVFANMIDTIAIQSKQQQQIISILQQQILEQQNRLETSSKALSDAEAINRQAMANFRLALNLRTVLLCIFALASSASAYFLD